MWHLVTGSGAGSGPGSGVRVVGVAVVRVRGGRGEVLAARRTRPPELAGRWELPGGKCGDGESLEQAARREMLEELGIDVTVGRRLAGVVPVGPGVTLEVVTARAGGDPVPTEHDRLAWLPADGLRSVDWLDPDVPFLDEVERLLRSAGTEPAGRERR